MLSALRESEFLEVRRCISQMRAPALIFSNLDSRQRRSSLKGANDTLKELMEKAVGLEVVDQTGWLIYHLKRLHPRGRYLAAIIEDFPSLEDYAATSEHLRKSYRRSYYKTFHTTINKVSGSSSMSTHRKFLDAQFRAMHHSNEDFQPLVQNPSWKSVLQMVNDLRQVSAQVPYTTLNKRQKKRRQLKHRALDKLIEEAAGSTDVLEQEAMLIDRLKKVHRNFDPFSWKRLRKFLDKLPCSEEFANSDEQNLKNRYKYPILNSLAAKLCGFTGKNKKVRMAFILSRFPDLNNLT